MAFPQNSILSVALIMISLSWKVWATVEVTMMEKMEVSLGDSAEIPCQYSFSDHERPAIVLIQWFVKFPGSGGKRQRIFYGDDSQQMVDEDTAYSGRITVAQDEQGSLLTIEDVSLPDEREFFCQVNGMAAGNGESKTQLRVFDPPESPVIEGVLYGISVTNELPSKVASCESRNGFPRPNITWYRDNIPLSPAQGLVKIVTLVTRESNDFYSVQSELQYKVTKEDKDAVFSCEVSYLVPGAMETARSREVNITVHCKPDNHGGAVEGVPQGLVKEGDTVELRCQGDGNPPSPLTFTREQDEEAGLEVTDDVLVLAGVTRADSGVYQCQTLDLDSYPEVSDNMQLTVHYLDPAVVVPKDSEIMYKGESLTATCNALSSLETSTVWLKNGHQVGLGHLLLLQDATYDTAGEYVCEVTVPSLPGLHTSGSVHIIVQGSPQVKDSDREEMMEVPVGKLVNLSCEVQGIPLPSFSWHIPGKQFTEVLSRKTEYSAHSVVSFKVTSDITAQCNASSDMGADKKSFKIKSIPMVTSTAPYSPAEGSGVIIVVIIICILLLAILVSVLYFLHKKGKIPCGRSGKQEITKENTTKDDIVVEMKSEAKTEEVVLLKGVNGDKKGPSDQYMDLRK